MQLLLWSLVPHLLWTQGSRNWRKKCNNFPKSEIKFSVQRKKTFFHQHLIFASLILLVSSGIKHRRLAELGNMGMLCVASEFWVLQVLEVCKFAAGVNCQQNVKQDDCPTVTPTDFLHPCKAMTTRTLSVSKSFLQPVWFKCLFDT